MPRSAGSPGKAPGSRALARRLCPRLDEDWLLVADRNFYNRAHWCAAADTGAALLWRVKADLTPPVLEILPDGSFRSVLISPKITGKARQRLIEAARCGQEPDTGKARCVRVIEYEIPGREGEGKGELIGLITTITEQAEAPAVVLAEGYHQRREHETGNDQLKTRLRGPGKVLRPRSPDMARQEIYGYLLTRHAISASICQAATEADVDPDRVKSTRTVRIIRRAIAPAAFPPEPPGQARAAITADITRKRHRNPERRHRTCPRAVNRARHNSYRVKKPSDTSTRHEAPPTIVLVNLPAAA